MTRHQNSLLKERTKHSQITERFANFRRDAVRRLLQIESDIKSLIVAKDSRAATYLRVLKDRHTEHAELEALLGTLERQKRLSTRLGNKRRHSKASGRPISRADAGPSRRRPVSRDDLRTLSRINSLSLCRPFSNLHSASKRSSMVLRNWPNCGDSFPEFGRPRPGANAVSASPSLACQTLFQNGHSRQASAKNTRDINRPSSRQKRRITHVVGSDAL